MANKEYFSHDYYARKDPKCCALIKEFGAAGYGVYWSLVETIYEQGGRIEKFPALYEGLAFELGVEEKLLEKQIEAMVHRYKLLQEDENFIWSNSILERLEIREEKRLTKSEAGRAGGIKSGESRRLKNNHEAGRSTTKQPFEANEPNEAKESKVKEKKVNTRRANALAGSGEPAQNRERDLKAEYEELKTSLEGKERKEAWTCLTTFIRDKSPEFIEPFAETWNLFAKAYKLPCLQDINISRRRKFSTRIREPAFDFLKILEGIKVSAHLKGENNGGWKVDFNWILENDSNYLKILEGNYN
jgi:hypothetical protein